MNVVECLHPKVSTHRSDLPAYMLDKALEAGIVGWDIETSGFDWRSDEIGTCQVFVPQSGVFVIQINGHKDHPNLLALLAEPRVRKIFHHAIFDLRFMLQQWSALIQNVACTKIASKIVNPLEPDHTLKAVLQRYLDVRIQKQLGGSDWLRNQLTDEQVRYATQDVIHLPALFEHLSTLLRKTGRWLLAEESFQYLTTRAQLDLLRAGDVFKYETDERQYPHS